jgi:hypothetical protein
MSRQLPAKPNLEHLKKQAKELLLDFQQSKPDAIDQFRAFALDSTPSHAKLADAQHVLARDYGFASWPRLKEHVESVTLTPAEQAPARIWQQRCGRRRVASHSGAIRNDWASPSRSLQPLPT